MPLRYPELLRLAAKAPGRAEWGALIRHKVDRLEALGVTLRCGVEAPRDVEAATLDGHAVGRSL
jgi:hypothetical protein